MRRAERDFLARVRLIAQSVARPLRLGERKKKSSERVKVTWRGLAAWSSIGLLPKELLAV